MMNWFSVRKVHKKSAERCVLFHTYIYRLTKEGEGQSITTHQNRHRDLFISQVANT